jgi:hypothetical protein
MSGSIRRLGLVSSLLAVALASAAACSPSSGGAPPGGANRGGAGPSSGGTGNPGGGAFAQGGASGTSFGGAGPSGGTFSGGGASGALNPGGGTFSGGGASGTANPGGGAGGNTIVCAPGQNRCECHTAIGTAVNKWIDTFEDGDTRIQVVDERDGDWYALPAGVATPISVQATSGGAPGSTKALHITGGVLDPQWPTYGVPLGICYDASAFDGISFWIKGDASGKNDTVKFSVSTPPTTEKNAGGSCPDGDKGCYNHFSALITLSSSWTKYSFKWSQLAQADWGALGVNGMAPAGYQIQKQILGVNFSPNENKKAYDFWVDDVEVGAGSTSGHCGEVVSNAQFESFFPGHAALYTYAGFVDAAKQWPLFCGEGDADARKREAAAFFAHMVQETAGLKFLEEQNPPIAYCDASRPEFPCGGRSYHGRGPLQISWNYNYGTAGRALGLSLLDNPGLVVGSSVNAFNTALWWWMTRQPLASAHSTIVSGKGFGQTIQLINGPLECGGKQPGAVQNRINAFDNFAGILGVSPGSDEGC